MYLHFHNNYNLLDRVNTQYQQDLKNIPDYIHKYQGQNYLFLYTLHNQCRNHYKQHRGPNKAHNLLAHLIRSDLPHIHNQEDLDYDHPRRNTLGKIQSYHMYHIYSHRVNIHFHLYKSHQYKIYIESLWNTISMVVDRVRSVSYLHHKILLNNHSYHYLNLYPHHQDYMMYNYQYYFHKYHIGCHKLDKLHLNIRSLVHKMYKVINQYNQNMEVYIISIHFSLILQKSLLNRSIKVLLKIFHLLKRKLYNHLL